MRFGAHGCAVEHFLSLQLIETSAMTMSALQQPCLLIRSRSGGFDVRRPNSGSTSTSEGEGIPAWERFWWRVWIRTGLTALLDRLPSLRLSVAPLAITFRPMPLLNTLQQLPVRH